uniref:Uncharacterized protein n=1 Tax=Rangifer tarandus platyrhynchus TaxID=3082113 RepID=A0ACB0E859_RANTA|nr:unnamed protein product [Rangifer tarandus platyrhynchus]
MRSRQVGVRGGSRPGVDPEPAPLGGYWPAGCRPEPAGPEGKARGTEVITPERLLAPGFWEATWAVLGETREVRAGSCGLRSARSAERLGRGLRSTS